HLRPYPRSPLRLDTAPAPNLPKRDRFISAGFIWANVISTTKGTGTFVVVFALVDGWDMPYNLPSSS
ncbi:MAG: hypothetical protein ACRDBK_08990, partial [Collinsella sp.]